MVWDESDIGYQDQKGQDPGTYSLFGHLFLTWSSSLWFPCITYGNKDAKFERNPKTQFLKLGTGNRKAPRNLFARYPFASVPRDEFQMHVGICRITVS